MYKRQAWTGVGVELIGGLLLAVGLATRPAALALAALTLVVHVEYRELNSNLYTIGLLLSLALTGARGLSLDQLLGKGMGDSALPGGLLLHRAVLDRHTQQVLDYRIVAPTEWNFCPGGPLASALADAPAVDETAARRLATRLVHSLDPCVACHVEIAHA